MNSTLNRPLSPHITIYLPQVSSLFSIWHRISGILLTTILFLSLYLLKFNIWLISFEVNFSLYVFHNLISFFLLFVFFLSFLYHFISGLRHILWDFGLFLTNKDIFISSTFIIIFLVISQILFIKILIC